MNFAKKFIKRLTFNVLKNKQRKKNQNCNKNKIHVLRDKSERSFNCNDFFVRFNFKKHNDLNKKKHETKNEQVVEKALF